MAAVARAQEPLRRIGYALRSGAMRPGRGVRLYPVKRGFAQRDL